LSYSAQRPSHAARNNQAPRNSRNRSKGSRPQPVAARGPFDNLPITEIDIENLPSFAELGLPRPLTEALARGGITQPFPIQVATIVEAMQGKDVLGRAATGAGKTLAFGLPMLARLREGTTRPRSPRGLVLVPTRELAMQVCDSLEPVAQAAGLSLRLVAGGLPINKQVQGLARGADIVVATPGRLIDLIERRACDLSGVQITVLDEADHMADLGFLPVVRRLLNMTPRDGQRLLFSATLDGDVATLVTEYLTDPVIKALALPTATVDTMEHHVFRVSMADKWPLINEIAAREGRTLLFVRTKHGAERLAKNLNKIGVAAGALHGGRTQPQRTKALTRFKDGSAPVLVATDVAARGIHVDEVSLVVHVDPPADEKDYLHRSGRTARAGSSGRVVTIVTPGEDRAVRTMMTAAGVRPDQRDAAPGDAGVAAVTGARTPSGVPIVEARPSSSGTSGRGGRAAHAGRGGSAGHTAQGGRPAQGGRSGQAGRSGAVGRQRPSGTDRHASRPAGRPHGSATAARTPRG
jgi:superfamily II DNA/RNA helicase